MRLTALIGLSAGFAAASIRGPAAGESLAAPGLAVLDGAA